MSPRSVVKLVVEGNFFWLWPAILCHGICCICIGLRPLCSCSEYGPGFATLHREGRGHLVSSSRGGGWRCGVACQLHYLTQT